MSAKQTAFYSWNTSSVSECCLAAWMVLFSTIVCLHHTVHTTAMSSATFFLDILCASMSSFSNFPPGTTRNFGIYITAQTSFSTLYNHILAWLNSHVPLGTVFTLTMRAAWLPEHADQALLQDLTNRTWDRLVDFMAWTNMNKPHNACWIEIDVTPRVTVSGNPRASRRGR